MNKPSTDHILSISAIITAIVAVWIAVVEQQSNREYQRISVKPYLELSNSNPDGYNLHLRNTGLGPAKIHSVDVNVEGKSISNWEEAVSTLTGDNNAYPMVSNLWFGRQIQAGEDITLLHLSEGQTAKKFLSSISKLNMKICYCSMYEECWIQEGSKIPELVQQCVNKNSF